MRLTTILRRVVVFESPALKASEPVNKKKSSPPSKHQAATWTYDTQLFESLI